MGTRKIAIKSFSSLTCIAELAKFNETIVPSSCDCVTWQGLTNFDVMFFVRCVE